MLLAPPGIVCETVCRMDAALEPPWMDSRRVSQTIPGGAHCGTKLTGYKANVVAHKNSSESQ
jgi:hypothetical protein